MKNNTLLLLLIVFFAFTASRASIVNERVTVFTTAKGLPDNTINDIAKDDQGYIWIATNKGVSRFDGKNFVTFSLKTNANFFKKDIVNNLVVDHNQIYLVSHKEGIKVLNRLELSLSTFISYPVQSFSIKGNQQIVLDYRGNLLVFKNKKQKQIRSFDTYNPHMILPYQNSIFVLTQGKGVVKVSRNTLKTERLLSADSIYMHGKLVLSKKSGLLYATGNKVYVLQNHRFVPHPLFKTQEGITNYFENQNHDPFYIYRSKTIFGMENHRFVPQKITSIKNLEIRQLFFVSPQCYYVATNQGLIRVVKTEKYISSIDDNPLVENDMIRIRRKIIPVNSQTFYLLGHPQIVLWQNGILKNIPSPNISTYDSVLIDSKIISTSDSYGIISFDIKSKKLEQIPLQSIPFREFFYVIKKGKEDDIILGGTNKIVFYNLKTKTTKIIPLHQLTVYSLMVKNNLLWIGTNNGLRCAFYNGQAFRWKKIPQFYTKVVRNIEFEPFHNTVWFGTEEDGLFIVNPNDFSFQQKKNSILKNIATITPDGPTTMWISTFNGIVVFDTQKKTQYQLTQKNGLSNMEFNYKSAALLNTSKMIFGGLNGYDCVDFTTLKKNVNENPQLVITGIQKSNSIHTQSSFFQNFNNQKEIRFNTGKEELKLTVSDVDVTGSFGSYFDYQIDKENVTPAYNNVIRISNLPYGKHDLTIRMFDDFGNLKKTKTIAINAIVPFYYHLSFYVGISITLLIFGSSAIYGLRKARKTEALVKDRIAMDLHDEVGSVLTRMLLITNSKKELEQQHQELKQGIREALFSIRTSIHVLSKGNNTLEDLIDDTKDFLKKEFSASSIEYAVTHGKDIPAVKLKSELFRDCKLILFEATVNTLKYAKATSFSIDFSIDKQLIITISDDGQLDAIESIYNKGNGIGNIIKRTERNKGTYSFSIHKPHGLQIQLIFDWFPIYKY